MKKFLFLDLDDTIFQTRLKCPPHDLLFPIAYYADGSVCSWMTKKQAAFFEWLHQEMILIPTTARDEDAFSRVKLPFASYAILNHGGTILQPNHQLDRVWHEKIIAALIQNNCHKILDKLGESINHFAQSHGFSGRVRFVDIQGMMLYLVLKDPAWKEGSLHQVQQDCLLPWLTTPEGANFYIHLNGNNLAVLPIFLNKSYAVTYLCTMLQEKYGEIMTFGMGDSYTDAPFMTQCDYAIVPPKTQLGHMIQEAQ